MGHGPHLPHRWTLLSLRLTGAGLLVATGAIHLDLYLTGYRSIPTIGWMFLFQVVTAFVLAAALVVTGSWAIAALGAGFAASTLFGYLLSVWIGLFGFKEVQTTAGLVAGAIGVIAVAVLTLYAVTDLNPTLTAATQPTRRRVAGIHIDARRGAMVVAAASLVGLGLLAASAAVAIRTPTSFASGTVELRSMHLGSVRILTNAQGFTLYWFALDTPTRSRCDGSCTAYWPPVTGSPTSAPDVDGTLGTIPRGGGVRQATFDGHPLYRYVGDAAPGEANGNGINLSGGIWHEVIIVR
jgi:predicted lipoprotein with Yx(FWY)xxD motif